MTGEFFQVAARLVVETLPPLILDTTVEDTLHFEWSVSKQRGSSPDVGTIKILNLDPAARQAISEWVAGPSSLVVSLYVGWAGIPEWLHGGKVLRVVPEHVEGTDVVTTIEVGDGAVEQRDTPPMVKTIVGGTYDALVRFLVDQMDLGIPFFSLALVQEAVNATPGLPAFFADVRDGAQLQAVLVGDPVSAMNDLMATIGLCWGQEDGQFVVYKGGLRNDVEPAVLTPETGLLSWSVVDDGGVEFEALCQPRVVPGAQIQVFGPGHQFLGVGGGPLRVETITFTGTSEGPNTMKGSARKVETVI